MKLVSLNIEGQKHLKRVREFLAKENADTVCLMECFADKVDEIVGEKYLYRFFAPNNIGDQTDHFVQGKRQLGLIMLSRYPWRSDPEIFYPGGHTRQNIPLVSTELGTHAPIVVMADIVRGSRCYRLGAVHFTWTPRGKITAKQRQDFYSLWCWLEGKEAFVLAGDFNLPRGNIIYQEMAKRYRDNIPCEVETTLDPVLHYANKAEAGRLKLVVDYIWSTPKYRVENVRVVEGISDHCGVVGEVI